METLHAYWRMQYVQADKKPSLQEHLNPFEKIALSPKKQWQENLVIWRKNGFFIMMNKYPYNPAHLMVLPVKVVPSIDDLTKKQRATFFEVVYLAKKILQKALKPDGFNIGINQGANAGAGISEHLHCHIVPRWQGDSNFMPVTCDTKILSSSMQSLWIKLFEIAKNEKL